jgi:hypothetical protein
VILYSLRITVLYSHLIEAMDLLLTVYFVELEEVSFAPFFVAKMLFLRVRPCKSRE